MSQARLSRTRLFQTRLFQARLFGDRDTLLTQFGLNEFQCFLPWERVGQRMDVLELRPVAVAVFFKGLPFQIRRCLRVGLLLRKPFSGQFSDKRNVLSNPILDARACT